MLINSDVESLWSVFIFNVHLRDVSLVLSTNVSSTFSRFHMVLSVQHKVNIGGSEGTTVRLGAAQPDIQIKKNGKTVKCPTEFAQTRRKNTLIVNFLSFVWWRRGRDHIDHVINAGFMSEVK